MSWRGKTYDTADIDASTRTTPSGTEGLRRTNPIEHNSSLVRCIILVQEICCHFGSGHTTRATTDHQKSAIIFFVCRHRSNRDTRKNSYSGGN